MKRLTIYLVIFGISLLPNFLLAQMKFKSIGEKKPIYFQLGYSGTKGAFVWYKGQTQPIPLKLKSLDIDSSDRDSGQPNFNTYKWTEVYNGKVTGEYGFTEWPRNVEDIYYKRYSDGRVFKFKVDESEEYDGKSMALLHNVQFHFYSFYQDSLRIVYPNGIKKNFLLNPLPEDKDRARYVYVEDYNFDGIDDIAFSVTDGEGLVVAYDVFIYNKVTKQFTKLTAPAGAKGCGEFTNLKINAERKELSTTCKSGPRWLGYTYKFNSAGKLYLLKNEE